MKALSSPCQQAVGNKTNRASLTVSHLSQFDRYLGFSFDSSRTSRHLLHASSDFWGMLACAESSAFSGASRSRLLLVDALKRLEYRGYDSAGVATLERRPAGAPARRGQAAQSGGAARQRAARGRRSASATPAGRRMGGRTETNAHPHATERLAVVHNGIIENFRELRDELETRAAQSSSSETDTEVVAHLVTSEMSKGKLPMEAVAAALPRLRGAFALAFLFEGEEDLLIGARKGSPLAIGYGEGEMFLGSDAIALAPFTDAVSYLEDGDCAVLYAQAAPKICDAERQQGRARRAARLRLAPSWSTRATTATSWRRRSTSSPRSSATRSPIISTWRPASVVLPDRAAVRLPRRSSGCRSRPAAPPITPGWSPSTGSSALRACRSRSMSPPSFATASRRWRRGAGAFRLAIRRDRRHARLAALRQGAGAARRSPSSTCRPRPSRARATSSLPTLAGPEIGVASTKAFTCQLAVLRCLAIAAGRARGMLSETEEAQAGATR